VSLPGNGFIALWNDIAPGRVDYDAWHTIEHVPERLSVAGFLRAHRYVLCEGSLARYFTIYALETLEVLDSEGYRRLVREPTAWTSGMRPDFRNFRRFVCRTRETKGLGVGGYTAVSLVKNAQQVNASEVCEAMTRQNGVSAAHFGEIHRSAEALNVNVHAAAALSEVTGVLIVEGYSAEALRRACGTVRFEGGDPQFADWSFYKLAFELRKVDLDPTASARPAPREPERIAITDARAASRGRG
jgi:hypothetical protein